MTTACGNRARMITKSFSEGSSVEVILKCVVTGEAIVLG